MKRLGHWIYKQSRSGIGLFFLLPLFLLGTLLTLAASRNEKTASPIDLNAYASLMSNRITRVEDLITRHYDQQDAFALLIPPGLELLNQPGNPDTLVIDLNSKELDATFTKALFSARPVYRNSVPAYEITLQETVQGTIEIRDNADQLLYTDPAPAGYVIPYELLFRQKQNPMLYYPELARYRLKTKLTLLPEHYVEHYLYAQARIAETAALLQEEEGGGMMLMREGMEEEVYISGMREETNGLLLELNYPKSYSESVWSAYSYDAQDTLSETFMGLENVWTLISSNIVLTGETSVAWIDTRPMGFDEQTNPVHRFYAFGANADSDNDGLSDGYELFVTKTNPDDPDSDGDGLNDGWEVANGIDPQSALAQNGAAGDPDRDGLSNSAEQTLGTNPNVWNEIRVAEPFWEYEIEKRFFSINLSKYGYSGFLSDKRYRQSIEYRGSSVKDYEAGGGTPTPCNPYGNGVYFQNDYHRTNRYASSTSVVWTVVQLSDDSEWTGECCIRRVSSIVVVPTGGVEVGQIIACDGTYHYTNYNVGFVSTAPSPRTTATDTVEFYHAVSTNQLSTNGYRVESMYYQNTLSDEYTTTQLLAEARSAYATATPGAWDWYGDACRDLSGDEVSIYLSGTRYRIVLFETEPDVVYSVGWAHIFGEAESGSQSVQRVHSVLVVGDGNEVVVGQDDGMGNYRPYYGNGGDFVADAPELNGCIFVDTFYVAAWVDSPFYADRLFHVGETNPPPPCGLALQAAQALPVYYNQVYDHTNKVVKDFDVNLYAGTFWDGDDNVSWSKVSGPDSGALVTGSYGSAVYRNPKEGGIYQFDATVGGATTRTQVWLPTAGPEISQWVINELEHLNSFASNYLAGSGSSRRFPIVGRAFRAADFGTMAAAADWLGQFRNNNGPCGGPVSFNVHDARHTIAGVVVERHKLSNMLIAYAGRKITGWPEWALVEVFNNFGTPDDEHVLAAYQAGFELFSGGQLSNVMQAYGYTMQAPESWAKEEWPNPIPPSEGGISRPLAFE